MIFIGSESRGYFAEEFATKKGLTFAYVEQSGHISDQVNDILEHGTQDFMIFDAEQYIDTASDLASETNGFVLPTMPSLSSLPQAI